MLKVTSMYRYLNRALIILVCLYPAQGYSLEPRYSSENAVEYFSNKEHAAIIMRINWVPAYWEYANVVSKYRSIISPESLRNDWKEIFNVGDTQSFLVLYSIKGLLPKIINISVDETVFETQPGEEFLAFFDSADSNGNYRLNPFEIFDPSIAVAKDHLLSPESLIEAIADHIQ